MSSLVLSDVAYAFPDGTPLFEGLDLAVGPGITSLVGRNGAGKSTLLRLCAGELSPSRGSVTAPGRVAFQPQVLTDARQGWTVADELGVAVSTVKTYAKTLRWKLHASSLAQLVVRALDYRFIT